MNWSQKEWHGHSLKKGTTGLESSVREQTRHPAPHVSYQDATRNHPEEDFATIAKDIAVAKDIAKNIARGHRRQGHRRQGHRCQGHRRQGHRCQGHRPRTSLPRTSPPRLPSPRTSPPLPRTSDGGNVTEESRTPPSWKTSPSHSSAGLPTLCGAARGKNCDTKNIKRICKGQHCKVHPTVSDDLMYLKKILIYLTEK